MAIARQSLLTFAPALGQGQEEVPDNTGHGGEQGETEKILFGDKPMTAAEQPNKGPSFDF